MPACVAHHAFGQDVIKLVSEDIRSCILAHKNEFDIGLQGPDVFYFYRPYAKNPVTDYGVNRHREPAIRMFSSILAKTHEGAPLSYMVGLVCHHALDATCHPYIGKHSKADLDHHRVEAAYDRHVLDKTPLIRSRHLLSPVRGLDFEALASLWPEMNARIIAECQRWRRYLTWIVDRKPLMRLGSFLPQARKLAPALSLPDTVPAEQKVHVKALDRLYDAALRLAKDNVERAVNAMGTSPDDLPGFETNYGGFVLP